jgi:formylglycine-generating enzyme required for sulfatase activity
MHGNDWEWCLDADKADGKGVDINDIEDKEDLIFEIAMKDSRGLRGGSFDGQPLLVRSAFRSGGGPADRDINTGFRPARTFSP